MIPGLWLFAPNRDTLGGSSWLLETGAADLLIDCPALSPANLSFLEGRTPGWILLTGRDGHGRCGQLQRKLGWPVVMQEQEAYLLPGLEAVTRFEREIQPLDGVRLLWTPGPSPGACVVQIAPAGSGGGHGLFCGRLLVPVAPGRLAPVRSRRSFHWNRQRRSLETLRQWLPAGSPDWIASGAPLGSLRGEKLVWEGARLLAGLDLEAQVEPSAELFNP